ncbi:MAG TPA: O-antigen ligase family protein [Kamptonema sp.]|nr:O-antigen ligase family protein [Kamptonema sp.]
MTAERRLQAAWNYTQLGLLIFPLIPILGALGMFLGLVATWKQKFHQIIRRPINQGLAILSIWLIITASFAHNPLAAFLGLGNFFPFFIFFAAFSTLIQTPAQLRRLSWILVITSIPVVILGFGQQFLNWASPIQLQVVSGWVLEPKGNPPGRMSSVFMYANILASYLTIVFILGLGLWFQEQKNKKEQGKKQSNLPLLNNKLLNPLSNYKLPFLSIAVIANATALILTNSRNAWGLAVFAGLTFALYLGWRTLVAVVVSATGGILWSAFGPDPVRKWLQAIVPYFIWGRLTDQMYQNRPVATLRKTQWEFAWNMTQQRPWTGWGLRNFTILYEAQMHRWLGHPHNLFLMLTAETGIPATLFLCGLVGWIFAQGILLLVNWQIENYQTETLIQDESYFTTIAEPASPDKDRLIFFSYLVAFAACTLFNTVDVTLFDLRVNTLGWLLLAAICGQVERWKRELGTANSKGFRLVK